ncbi:hypothetical protein OQA88_4584 [Cercophora sp. LCS_1]
MATSASTASHPSLHRDSLFSLKDRIALVTGGGSGSGIGLMITQTLADNGAKVYIAGRDKSKLDAVVFTYGRAIERSIIPFDFSYNACSRVSHAYAGGRNRREWTLDPGQWDCAGSVSAEMTAGESDEYQKSHVPKEKHEGKCPGARPGRDIDMAQAVLVLASNHFVNGQTLVADGGCTLAAGL